MERAERHPRLPRDFAGRGSTVALLGEHVLRRVEDPRRRPSGIISRLVERLLPHWSLALVIRPRRRRCQARPPTGSTTSASGWSPNRTRCFVESPLVLGHWILDGPKRKTRADGCRRRGCEARMGGRLLGLETLLDDGAGAVEVGGRHAECQLAPQVREGDLRDEGAGGRPVQDDRPQDLALLVQD